VRITHDLFISYRQCEPDVGWVRNRLVPALEAAGLHVFVDYRDFTVGEPLDELMERGIATSRFTLAVVSSRYDASRFTAFESALAPERLLAILTEDCESTIAISARRVFRATTNGELKASVEALTDYVHQSTI
jgi:hypothetical protein